MRTLAFDVDVYSRGNKWQDGSPTWRCQGCNHSERVRIERLLAAGASIKGAARKFAKAKHPLELRDGRNGLWRQTSGRTRLSPRAVAPGFCVSSLYGGCASPANASRR